LQFLDALLCLMVVVQRHFRGHHSMKHQPCYHRLWQVHPVSAWILTQIWAVVMFTPIILLASSVRVFAPAVFSRLCLWLPNITESCPENYHRKLRTQICCMILGWNLGQIVIYSSTPTPSRAVEFSGEKSQQLVNAIHGEGDGDGPILCECTHKVMTALICDMFDLVYSRTDSILTSNCYCGVFSAISYMYVFTLDSWVAAVFEQALQEDKTSGRLEW
jgi:hypothetical protein